MGKRIAISIGVAIGIGLGVATLRSGSYAFFEFAPINGSGMGAACSCSAVTGAKGEALTFTRASSGSCMKGNTSTGIANGDLVTCSTDKPRVMPGGSGTGALGLRVEGSRTNDLLRSEEFDNAAWIDTRLGAAAITITANAAVAPDGTTTAERFQIPAASSIEYTMRAQTGLVAANRIGFVFVKGNAQSGTFYLLEAGGDFHCAVCNYNPTTWTYCANTTVTTNMVNFHIGSDPSDCGGGDQPAKDVFVWGAQSEPGTFPSSYIQTTSAAVTRAADTASFAGIATSLGSVGSVAATVNSSATGTLGMIYFASTSVPLWYAATIHTYDGTTDLTLATTFSTQPHRYASSWSGSTLSIFDVTAGTSSSGSFDGTMTTTSFILGAGQGGGASSTDYLFGVIKQVCADPSATRCR